MKYDFNTVVHIQCFAFDLLQELEGKTFPLKNTEIIEAISKIHGYKNWNTYRAFLKKNYNKPEFIQVVNDIFNSLTYRPHYDFTDLSDIKYFSYAFRKHLQTLYNDTLSKTDILNSIALCMGYKTWRVLEKSLNEREKRIDNINKILNQENNHKSFDGVIIKQEYIDNPFAFFRDLVMNREQDGQHLWWGRSLFMFKNILDALIELKNKKILKLNIDTLKENLYIEKYTELSKNENLDLSTICNIKQYLNMLPGYSMNNEINDLHHEQHGYLLMQLFRLIDQYIYYGENKAS